MSVRAFLTVHDSAIKFNSFDTNTISSKPQGAKIMAYDIRLVKIVTGDMVLGKWDEQGNKLTDLAMLQMVPTQQGGVQMLLLPFGYPIDNELTGEIDGKNVIYFYKNTPEDLKNKYLEASSNLTISSAADLKNLNLGGPGKGKVTDMGSLFKK